MHAHEMAPPLKRQVLPPSSGSKSPPQSPSGEESNKVSLPFPPPRLEHLQDVPQLLLVNYYKQMSPQAPKAEVGASPPISTDSERTESDSDEDLSELSELALPSIAYEDDEPPAPEMDLSAGGWHMAKSADPLAAPLLGDELGDLVELCPAFEIEGMLGAFDEAEAAREAVFGEAGHALMAGLSPFTPPFAVGTSGEPKEKKAAKMARKSASRRTKPTTA